MTHSAKDTLSGIVGGVMKAEKTIVHAIEHEATKTAHDMQVLDQAMHREFNRRPLLWGILGGIMVLSLLALFAFLQHAELRYR